MQELTQDDIAKLAKAAVAIHPNPVQLLNQQLKHTMTLFIPKTSTHAIEFTVEFIEAAAKYAAIILGEHAAEHPEKAKDCVPELRAFLLDLFGAFCDESLKLLCADMGVANPLEGKSVNQQTYEDILETIKREHSGA